jgi:hypothetical protein
MMPPQSVETRIERLDERVTILEQLPARMDTLESQILQSRQEMRAEFSALLEEMRSGFSSVEVRLTAKIAEVDERLGTQMRVLHEDAIARIALMKESVPKRRRSK